jgi:hypothetical protein
MGEGLLECPPPLLLSLSLPEKPSAPYPAETAG